jgi:hypothetical protein
MSFSTTCDWSDIFHGSDEDSWSSPFQEQDINDWNFSDEKHEKIQEWHPFNPHQYETVLGLSHLVQDSCSVTTISQKERKSEFSYTKNCSLDISHVNGGKSRLNFISSRYSTQEHLLSPSGKTHTCSSVSMSIDSEHLEKITVHSSKCQELLQGGISNESKPSQRDNIENMESVQQKALSWDAKLKKAREQQLKLNPNHGFHQELKVKEAKKLPNFSYKKLETEKQGDYIDKRSKLPVEERIPKLCQNGEKSKKHDIITNENLVRKHSGIDRRQNANDGTALKDVVNIAPLDLSTSYAEKTVTDKRLWLENVFKTQKATHGSSSNHIVPVIRSNGSPTDKVNEIRQSKSFVQRRRSELEKKVQEVTSTGEKSKIITKVEWHQKNGKYRKKLIILKKWDEDI